MEQDAIGKELEDVKTIFVDSNPVRPAESSPKNSGNSCSLFARLPILTLLPR